MKQAGEVTTLFLDVGGVLLSKGWGHESRALAAQRFGLDPAEMQQRHNLTFDTYEVGKLSLDEYLDRTVFYQPRPFTRDQFREFIFAQSQPHPEMIELVCKLKRRHALKIAVVNNEGRELNSHRIRAFKLGAFADFFISSCFVHFRKPDVDIFRLALDTAQVPAEQVVYIDDEPMFVQIAQSLGIRGIRHTDYRSTKAQLAALGLTDGE